MFSRPLILHRCTPPCALSSLWYKKTPESVVTSVAAKGLNMQQWDSYNCICDNDTHQRRKKVATTLPLNSHCMLPSAADIYRDPRTRPVLRKIRASLSLGSVKPGRRRSDDLSSHDGGDGIGDGHQPLAAAGSTRRRSAHPPPRTQASSQSVSRAARWLRPTWALPQPHYCV